MISIAHCVFWISLAVVLYTHIGYPLLAVLLARPSTRRLGGGELPKITLIIPAHNEEVVLRDKLRNSLSMDYPRDCLEIIVASDGSRDATNAIAASFAEEGARLLAFENRRGKASVLNDAVGEASGDVLCFCDANVMFRPDALKIMAAHFADPQVGAVTGDVRLASHESNFGAGESLYYRIERRLQLAESSAGSVMGVDGGMYLLRRELFQPIPADTILDDFVISVQVMNKGRRVIYDPEAIATENGTPTARQEFRRRVRVAAGAVQVLKRGQIPSLWRHPFTFWQFLSHKLARWLGPVWLLALLLANAALWSEGALFQACLVVQVLFYGSAAVGAVWLPWRESRLGSAIFYFVLSHVAIMVGLMRGLLNRQRVTWTQAERVVQGP